MAKKEPKKQATEEDHQLSLKEAAKATPEGITLVLPIISSDAWTVKAVTNSGSSSDTPVEIFTRQTQDESSPQESKDR